MSSLLKSFLDPKKTLSRRLRHYGTRCDERGSSREALDRLTKEMVGVETQGLKRAVDLPTKPGYLPENLQAMQSPFRNSLLAHVKKEAGPIRALHQARFYSSVAAEQIQATPTESKKNILRPLSPHLPIYQPQISSTLSITHRISVAYLTGLALSFHLLYLKMGPVCLSFADFYQFLFYSSKLNLVALELGGLSLAYHLWIGIRHMRK